MRFLALTAFLAALTTSAWMFCEQSTCARENLKNLPSTDLGKRKPASILKSKSIEIPVVVIEEQINPLAPTAGLGEEKSYPIETSGRAQN